MRRFHANGDANEILGRPFRTSTRKGIGQVSTVTSQLEDHGAEKLECLQLSQPGSTLLGIVTAKGIMLRMKKRDSLYQHQEVGKQEKNHMGVLLTMDDGNCQLGDYEAEKQIMHLGLSAQANEVSSKPEISSVSDDNSSAAIHLWTNANRVNHANQFVPRSVQLNAGRSKFNSVRPNINTGRTNINVLIHTTERTWHSMDVQMKGRSNKYCDKHNQVGFLRKPDESAGFAEIVDFLRGSNLRYALTTNPTIYDSLVKQFASATAITKADGVS
ncbi:hypothetical protein Tco_0109436 [Tanacetum coccineum]